MSHFCPFIARAVIGCAMALASLSSFASPLSFNFDAASGPDLAFTLDESPVPNVVGVDYFELHNVAALVDGISNALDLVRFFESSSLGGFNVQDGGGVIFDTTGAQLFSGTTAAPTFVPGMYHLDRGSSFNSVGGTLTIRAVPGRAVPEPATLGLLGLGLAGLALSRRKRN